MKTCKVCGAMVDDKEWNCPECGATMITSGGAFSLKQGSEPVKKKSGHTLGTTVSTGSGLTDILRAEDDVDDSPTIMGSVPISLSQNHIDEEEVRKRAKAHRQLIGNIFKIILVLAVAFGIYLYVTKVIMAPKGAEDYENVVDTYVEAVKNNDVGLMKSIMPHFISDRNEAAADMIENMSGVTISSYKITSSEAMSDSAIDIFNDNIKLSTGKIANISEGYTVEVEFAGTGKSGKNINKVLDMEIYRVNNLWFLYPYTFDVNAFD